MHYRTQSTPSPSPIEAAFWEAASPRIPNLQREVWIGRYRVDFLIPDQRIIIELEGYAYHQGKDKRTQDARRERELELKGYRVITFTGTEIYRDVEACVEQTLQFAQAVSVRPSAASAGHAPRPHVTPPKQPAGRAARGFRPWQWAVIGALGLSVAIGITVFLALAASGPSVAVPALSTVVPTNAAPATAGPALRITECAIDWSISWRSLSPGQPTTLTPPAGATCGILQFTVSSGERPVIVLNNERHADLGSCLSGCLVYVRAAPVSIDVQGLVKPDAQWRVHYYWNGR